MDLGSVEQVFPASPASDAGLVAGDRLLEINGEGMNSWSATRLRDLFQRSEPGTRVDLRVQHGEKAWNLTLVLRELR